MLGYRSSKKNPCIIAEWLREEMQIHVEAGSIWDDLTNTVESYYYTVTAPIRIYYMQPVYCSEFNSCKEALIEGLEEGLKMLRKYNEQQHIKVSDDMVVIAYLKGFGDKGNTAGRKTYSTNLENYAYTLGQQGDYIEEGLTEYDILFMVRNEQREKEKLRLE